MWGGGKAHGKLNNIYCTLSIDPNALNYYRRKSSNAINQTYLCIYLTPCLTSKLKIMPIGLAFIVYKLVSWLTSIADEIVPIGLALIVYKLVSWLTLIADEIVPICLALIVPVIVLGF